MQTCLYINSVNNQQNGVEDVPVAKIFIPYHDCFVVITFVDDVEGN